MSDLKEDIEDFKKRNILVAKFLDSPWSMKIFYLGFCLTIVVLFFGSAYSAGSVLGITFLFVGIFAISEWVLEKIKKKN